MMEFDDATDATMRILRRRPTEVLAPFLAESAIAVVAQSTFVVAAGLSLLALGGSPRLERSLDALRELLSRPITPGEAEVFVSSLADLFTPTVVAIVGGAILVAFALGVLVRSATGAAKVHTAWAAMTDGTPTEAAVGGTLADVRTFVRFTLLQALVFLGIPALMVAVVGGVGPSPGAVLILGGLALLWVPIALFGYFALLFVPEILVVEGVGVIAGIRRNFSYLRTNFGRAVLYAILEVGALIGVGTVNGILGTAGIGRVGGLLVLFVVAPFLGLVKMGLYADPVRHPEVVSAKERQPRDAPRDSGYPREDGDRSRRGDRDGRTRRPDDRRDPRRGERQRRRREPDRRPREREPVQGRIAREPPKPGPDVPPGGPVEGQSGSADLRALLAAGTSELRGFVGRRPGLILLSLVVFLAGVVGGYRVGRNTGIDIGAGSAGADLGLFPVGPAINLAANNWQVAIGQAFAGLAFGVPTFVNLAFNGAIVGGLASLGFDMAVFAALILPHGVIEVPALAISGGLGLHLALRGVGVVRGTVSTEAAGDELERAVLVLLGLLPAFVLAGIIEAFVTPVVGDVVASAVG